MRSFVAVLAVGLAAVVAIGLTQRSGLVYSLGVSPALRATQIAPDNPACQGPIHVPNGAMFDRVGFVLARLTDTPPVRVEVREADGGRVLASGRLDSGWRDFVPRRTDELVVHVGPVRTTSPVELCLVDEGRAPVAVIGQAGAASPTTSATRTGKPITTDLAFTLRRGDRPLLVQLPDIARRAAVFRAGWVTPAVYLVLALLIVIAAPIALARGLRRAETDQSTASTMRQ